MKMLIATAVLACLAGITAPSSRGASISYDQVIFQNDASLNPALLSGSISMNVLSGSRLQILLQNTSANTGTGDFGLLTGMGFVLPGGMSISGGTVNVAPGSAAVHFTGNDLSTRYEYANLPIAGYNHITGVLPIQNVLTSVQNGQASHFAGHSSIGGPDYGSESAAYTGLGQQTAAVRDTVEFDLTLQGSYSGDLLSFIDAHNVILAFGSPDTARHNVPDGGLTIALLGFAIVSLQTVRRRLAR